MKKKIEDALRQLVGMRLLRIRLTGSIRGFGFTSSAPGQMTYDEPGEWTLQVDCTWRVEHDGKIYTGTEDWYEYPGGKEPNDWDPDDNRGLQVELLRKLMNDESTASDIRNVSGSFAVEAVEASDCGDVVIHLGPGEWILRVFPSGSVGDSWALFRREKGGTFLTFHGSPPTDSTKENS
jgi:hypothetical protein